MSCHVSRRTFLGTGLAAASLLSTPRIVRAQPSAGLRVRLNANAIPDTHLVFQQYAAAVDKMHKLPANDPRHWRNQAIIHADHCQHGTLEFLPWHRHYLNQFEQICGEMIGEPDFALPYWDWTYGRGIIPNPFFDMDQLNVTFWKDNGQYSSPNWPDIDTVGIRAIGREVGVQDDPQRGGAFTANNINSILKENTFSRFSGRLESSPHNSGHVVVGFAPQEVGHMGSGLSPLDPLFWLHHCNVDRLWAQWQVAGNATPNFPGQYNGQFVDKAGNPVNVTAQSAVDFRLLGYTYDQISDPEELIQAAGLVDKFDPEKSWLTNLPRANFDASIKKIGGSMEMRKIEMGIPSTIPISVPALKEELGRTRRSLDTNLPDLKTIENAGGLSPKMLAQFGRPVESSRRILAILRGVKGVTPARPVVNVFLNCPYLSPETPFKDAHFADTFALFGHSAHGQGEQHPQSILVDLTNALRELDLNQAERIDFQLMPLSPVGRDPQGQIEIGGIEIISA